VGARFLQTSLLLDAIIIVLDSWHVQNHHLNTAIESALLPLACVAVFQRYIATFSLYAGTKQKRYLLSAIPGSFATTLLCKRPNVMMTSPRYKLSSRFLGGFSLRKNQQLTIVQTKI